MASRTVFCEPSGTVPLMDTLSETIPAGHLGSVVSDPSAGTKRAVSVALLAPRNIGPFDYLVTSGAQPPAGTLVRVPLGGRLASGVVVGEGDMSLAVKEVAQLGPTFLSSQHLELCRRVSLRWLAPLASTFKRAFPAPLEEMLSDPSSYAAPDRVAIPTRLPRRYVSVSPGIEMREAAALALKNILDGVRHILPSLASPQILVLCPTREMVTEVRRRLASEFAGAGLSVGRLDRGSLPRWRSGELSVGVGTRAAALWEAPNLVGYVVVEASHPGHVEESQPYSSSAEIAVIAARLTGAAVTLLGDVPSPTYLWGGVVFEEWGSRTDDWPQLVAVPREFGSDPACPPKAAHLIAKHLGGRPTRAPASVALVSTARTSRLRCLRCSESFPPPDITDSEEPVSEEEILVPGRFWACPRCKSSELMMWGWSPEVLSVSARRLQRALGRRSRSVSVEVVSPPALFTESFDVVVIPGADRYGVSVSDPGLSAARLIMHAARSVTPEGLVVLTSVSPGGSASSVAATRSVKAVAKKGWDLALQHQLPPHRREVWVTSDTALPSPPGSLEVSVHGPRRLPSGDHELLLRCRDTQLPAVSAWLADLRSRQPVRVKVN